MDVLLGGSAPVVAYFSMEMHLDARMHTYSGGLGVLAGDTLRAAADMGAPLVGVTLAHRKGYFRQHLDEEGNQTESCDEWRPEDLLKPVPAQARVWIEGREVRVRAWEYEVRGRSGRPVPVYLLDTRVPENTEWDQGLSDYLYGGDEHYRLCQEVVLGIGGVELLRELGVAGRVCYHMNEGHSALLTLALLGHRLQSQGRQEATEDDLQAVREQCVFTTHTPVPAGHDQFGEGLVRQVLSPERLALLEATGCCTEGVLNMTYLGLHLSRYVNGVGMRHGEVSSSMFPGYPIDAITNGVHAPTWVSEPFAELYDRRVPEWREDNLYLRYMVGAPLEEIREAHQAAKRRLLEVVKERTGRELEEKALTIGFARRATSYKRADLLFSDLARLRAMAAESGPLQVVYAGKAHPRDGGGKDLIRRVFAAARELGEAVPVVYLEDYDAELGKLMCAGVDVWLNTPLRPQEASGTSGMKAALNGVPSLSVLDGWWIEGHVEGVTGWSIGDTAEGESDQAREVESLYEKLSRVVIPCFYERPEEWGGMMRSAIALNGSFFNTQRMLAQYVRHAYLASLGAGR